MHILRCTKWEDWCSHSNGSTLYKWKWPCPFNEACCYSLFLFKSCSLPVLGSTPFHELFLLWPGCSVEVTVGFVEAISTTESDFALECVLMLVSPVSIPSSLFSVLLLLFCLSWSVFWSSEFGLELGMFVVISGTQKWLSRAGGRGSLAGFPGGVCSDRVPRAFVMDSLRSRDQDAVVKLSVASQNWTRWSTFWACMNWIK